MTWKIIKLLSQRMLLFISFFFISSVEVLIEESPPLHLPGFQSHDTSADDPVELDTSSPSVTSCQMLSPLVSSPQNMSPLVTTQFGSVASH